jgi:hypothetical protein
VALHVIDVTTIHSEAEALTLLSAGAEAEPR